MKNLAYIFVMAAVTYLIRAVPLVLFRKPVKNVFLKSFLYYLPYVTLAVMTFPAIMDVTHSWIAGLAALVLSSAAAYFGLGLLPVALIASGTVFLLQLFL
ncbi:MAG: AzlD domain-containing protein [Lachnospiraceae bacterium]|nr:AzlD domain-containing protein [Lachnospiraceae bacterium]